MSSNDELFALDAWIEKVHLQVLHVEIKMDNMSACYNLHPSGE